MDRDAVDGIVAAIDDATSDWQVSADAMRSAPIEKVPVVGAERFRTFIEPGVLRNPVLAFDTERLSRINEQLTRLTGLHTTFADAAARAAADWRVVLQRLHEAREQEAQAVERAAARAAAAAASRFHPSGRCPWQLSGSAPSREDSSDRHS